MAKKSFVLLPFVLASALVSAQVLGPAPAKSESNLQTPFGGSTLTCSQPPTIVVPRPFIERAKLKARLLTLLRDSLYDDAKGIVNIAREKEIRKLANKLNNDTGD